MQKHRLIEILVGIAIASMLLCSYFVDKAKVEGVQAPIQLANFVPKVEQMQANLTIYEEFPSYIAEVTYYDLCVGCCGKLPTDPAYGITASGKYVQANHTVAAPPEIPFGTKLLIGNQVYTVEDRGSAIQGNKLDVYVPDHTTGYAMGGKHNVKVYILQWGGGK